MIITGTKGNLGSFLQDKFNDYDYGLHRDTTIVHCAANLTYTINTNNLYKYYCDNIKLTEQLCSLPHNLFIFISSIDVYPKDARFYTESENINLKEVSNFYGQTKLIAESIVKNQSKNHIIIRQSSPLGTKHGSTIAKILDNKQLFLTASSSLNCILYEDIYTLIKFILDNNIKNEIFNLVANRNIDIRQMVNILNPSLYKQNNIYGTYYNTPGNINGSKVYDILPQLNKSSKENIKQWLI